MTRPLRFFLCAGEHSGDLHGAALAKRIREYEPDAVLQGLGGPLMAAEGVETPFNFVEHAAMGIVPVLKKLPFFRATLAETAARLAADPPDVFVPIDYPGFNLRLSGRAKKAGVQVCYYVSPQVWAWRPGRIHRIARLVDHMLTLFPFEADLYEGVGVDATFVGHPLFDELRVRRPTPGFREGLGLEPETHLLGILPGSRQHEVERNLPTQLAAARLVRDSAPEVRFAIPLAKPSLAVPVQAALKGYEDLGVTVLEGKASDIARVARAAITVSGTANLELLHYECPMVILYQLTHPQAWLAKRLLTTEWISLVNILAQKEICPEYLAPGDPSVPIAEDALALLRPGRKRKRCLTAMTNLKKVVDPKGVHMRAAETVVRLAREARSGAAKAREAP